MFWHKLAGHLGKTKEELKEKISLDEFIEWKAFFKLDPWGEARIEMIIAKLCQLNSTQRIMIEDLIYMDEDEREAFIEKRNIETFMAGIPNGDIDNN